MWSARKKASMERACFSLFYPGADFNQNEFSPSARGFFVFLRQMAIFKILCGGLSLLPFPASLLRIHFAIDFNMQSDLILFVHCIIYHLPSFVCCCGHQLASLSSATADPNMQLRRIIGPNACCGLCSKSSETRKKRKRLYAHFQIQFLGLRGRQSRERPES